MGSSCCKILGNGSLEVSSVEEALSPKSLALQLQQPVANVLLHSAGASRHQMHGTKQGCLKDLVTAKVVEKKAPDPSLADFVLGLGLAVRTSAQRKAVVLERGGEVADLAFSPDGSSLLTGGEDAVVVLRDLRRGTERTLARMSSAVRAVAFAPDGQHAAAGDAGSRAALWHTATSKEVAVVSLAEGEVLSLALGCRPRPLLAAATAAGTLVLMAFPEAEELARLQPGGLLHGICFSPDGGLLAGGCGTGDLHGLAMKRSRGHDLRVAVWRVPPSGGGRHSELASLPFGGTVHATAFSPSGKLLAAGSEDRTAATFLVERNFEQVASLPCPAGVRCLAWTSDSRYLASGGEDMQVSIWDIIAERIILQLPQTEDWLQSIAWSPDGSWVASTGFESCNVTLQPVEIIKVGLRPRTESVPVDDRCPVARPASGPVAGVDIVVSQHADAPPKRGATF